MSIPAECPSCGQAFRVAEKAVGKKIQCPACSYEYIFVGHSASLRHTDEPQAAGADVAVSAPPSPHIEASAPQKVVEAPTDQEGFEFAVASAKCGACGADLDPAAQFCVACGTYVATGAHLQAVASTGKKDKAARKKTAMIITLILLAVLLIAVLTAWAVL